MRIRVMIMRSLLFGIVLISSSQAMANEAMKTEKTDETAEKILGGLERANDKGLRDAALAERSADALSRIVGVGVSPAFAIAAFGLYDWYEGRTSKWYSHPIFTMPMLFIFLLIFLKDVLGAPLGPLKQIADSGEVIVNKLTGSLGMVATMAYCADSMGVVTGEWLAQGCASIVGTAHAAPASEIVGGIWVAVGSTVAAIIAGLCFFVVWLTGQFFNIMILMNPFSPIDPFLKSIRGGFVLVLTVTCMVFPPAGILFALLYIVLAWLVAGYCLRFVGWGTVVAWDVLFLSGKGEVRDEKGILVFAGNHMEKIPKRTFGRIRQNETNDYEFVYRPWFFLPEKSHALNTTGHELIRGVIYPSVQVGGANQPVVLYSLAPRYRGLEEHVCEKLGISRILDTTLTGGVKDFRAWLTSIFSEQTTAQTN